MAGTGLHYFVVANAPASVLCDDALLATALRSVGVPLHPETPLSVQIAEDGSRIWQWLFAEKSADGLYKTQELIEWWKNAEWHAQNPSHEFALVARVLRNHAVTAGDLRSAIPVLKMVRGSREVYIPENASPALREFRIAQLEGRIAINAEFSEP